MIRTKSFELAEYQKGDPDSDRLALVLPGRLDTKDYPHMLSHVDFLAGLGFHAISFDPPGTWESPGSINEYSTSTYIDCIHELIDHFDNKPTLLLGHSRGGATAMLASTNSAVSQLVVINASYGPPSKPDPDKVIDGVLTEYRDIPSGSKEVSEYKRFALPLAYFEDGAKHNPLDALLRFNKPKLIIHAIQDEFTKVGNVQSIFSDLSKPKVIYKLKGDHDYRKRPEEIEEVNQVVKTFLEKYS